jgi:hypothetical protein
MSANKFRYYDVTVTKTVRALNQTDAIALATSKSRVDGKVLATFVNAERISANEAHQVALQAS